ncbi:PAS domain-containing protein, partial [Sulfuricurvum sp.]|uniref:PAS domain-containing protein n=1 Tax=Sulfuricurvum sp. TaxID=2025608 RepID=UPI00263799D8
MGENKQTLQKDIVKIHSVSNQTNTNLLQAILESSPNIIIFALDTKYNYLAFNQEHKKAIHSIWGKEIELGMNILEIIARDDDNQKAKNLFDRALSGETFIDENEYGDEALSRKFWQTYYSPIYDEREKNVIGLTCFNLDISERREIENQLQLADLALNMITDAIYLINEDSKIIYVNKAACDSLGYTKEELLAKTPFDIDPVITLTDMNKIRETVGQNKVMRFETKHKRKDGSIIDVEINTYPYINDHIRYKLSIVKDITDRKKTEEKLKLLASVFSCAKEGIVITDTSGIIVDANEAYTLITGYTKDEVIGKNAGYLKSDKHDINFYKHMWNELIRNKYWIGEIWNRRKNGEIFVERVTISAITDSEGKTSSYVGLLTDITTGKDYESSLERMAFYD